MPLRESGCNNLPGRLKPRVSRSEPHADAGKKTACSIRAGGRGDLLRANLSKNAKGIGLPRFLRRRTDDARWAHMRAFQFSCFLERVAQKSVEETLLEISICRGQRPRRK